MNYQTLKSLIPTDSVFKYEDFFDVIPELISLKQTMQDSYFHAEGDVWTHTKMVCDSLLASHDYQQANEEDKFILFYSALLHDISKPICTKQEGDRITSKGHSKIGSIDARIILWKMDVPFTVREKIANIIANHQVPFFAFNNNKGISPHYTAYRLSWELPLDLLITVAKADMNGRYFELKQDCLNDIEIFKLLAEEENCLYNQKSFPDCSTRLKYFRSQGEISPDYPFFTQTGSDVIVMCGLPASGKDTWCETHKGNRTILSFDDTIKEMGLTHTKNVGKAIHEVINNAKELLRKKEPFIWNATHLSQQMRNKTLDLLFNYNAHISLQYIECSHKELFTRNQQRDFTLTNDKLKKMLHKWEVPTPIETHDFNYLITTENKKTFKPNN